MSLKAASIRSKRHHRPGHVDGDHSHEVDDEMMSMNDVVDYDKEMAIEKHNMEMAMGDNNIPDDPMNDVKVLIEMSKESKATDPLAMTKEELEEGLRMMKRFFSRVKREAFTYDDDADSANHNGHDLDYQDN